MALAESLILKLLAAGVKAAFKAWLPKHEFARGLLDAAVDPLVDQLKPGPEKAFVLAVQDKAATALRTAYGGKTQAQAHKDTETQEALATILETLNQAAGAVVEARFEPTRIGETLMPLLHANNRWKWLSAPQHSACETVLHALAAEVGEHASQFPQFQEAQARETLTRMDALVRETDRALVLLQELLKALPEVSEAAEARRDRDFEFRYRQHVGHELDFMELFGIDIEEVAQRYPLSVAYVRLQVSVCGDPGGLGTERQAETMLAPLERITIRGGAGSGKSTLLQWLAVHTAAGDFRGPMEHWNGRVPFFIRLREWATVMQEQSARGKQVTGPPPKDWVRLTVPLLEDADPDGWADRQLKTGRALLLIDGLDEVPEELRKDLRRWIISLQELGGRFLVVSSRPYLDRNWLDGFTECDIAPLDLGSAFELVRRWHDAIGRQERDEARLARLPEIELDLRSALQRQRSLRNLVTNPLLCAMVCALHHKNPVLPDSRVPLYEACCRGLIDEREAGRRISPPERLRWLNGQHKLTLLEELAYWMVKNSKTEVSVEEVDDRLECELQVIPQRPTDVSASEVRIYFVRRSGLLSEPLKGRTLEFVHKTFMEFLAARAAVNAGDYRLLVDNADRDEWTEVIRLAAGYVPHVRYSRELLEGLLDGSQEGNCERRRLLAVSCLETCIRIEPDLQVRLRAVLESLVPPRSPEAVRVLILAGPLAVPFLNRRSDHDEDAWVWNVVALARIGGEDALFLLDEYAENPGESVRNALERAWAHFDSVEYARRILRLALRERRSFCPSGMVTLAGLEELTWLEELDLSQCPEVTDLTPVLSLPGLCEFTNKDGAPMVWVPTSSHDPEDTDGTNRTAQITRGFWFSRTPVTNMQFEGFVRVAGDKLDLSWFFADSQPQLGVSWNDAMAYCQWAGGRLPTEAEWVQAAEMRDKWQFPWNGPRGRSRDANESEGFAVGRLSSTLTRRGIAWCGAVDDDTGFWEWCLDQRQRQPCDPEPTAGAAEPNEDRDRLLLTSWWLNPPTHPNRRDYWNTESSITNAGFRVVVGGDSKSLAE